MDGLRELHVPPHPIAVAADVDEVAPVEQPVEESGRHDLVVQDLAPVLEALVRGQHGRGVSVAGVDPEMLFEERAVEAAR